MDNVHEIAGLNEKYALSAKKVIELESSMEVETCLRAAELTVGVLEGEFSVCELRGGVRWANALAQEVTVGRLSANADIFEATARKIMHKSGRVALNYVKTESRLITTRVVYASSRASAETQVIEANQTQLRALRTESLVQYMMKEGR